MNELFAIAPSLSPRLKWMQENNVTVKDNGGGHQPGDECPETGARLYRYCASRPNSHFMIGLLIATRTGWGDTEDEAIVDLAKKLNLRLWNEQAQP